MSFVSVVLLASSVQLLLCEVPFLQIIDFPCTPEPARASYVPRPTRAQQSVIGMMTMPSPAAQSFPLCAHKEPPPCRAWTTTSHMASGGRSRLRRPVEVRKDSPRQIKMSILAVCIVFESTGTLTSYVITKTFGPQLCLTAPQRNPPDAARIILLPVLRTSLIDTGNGYWSSSARCMCR